MPHYIILLRWTEQGIRNVKESPKRARDLLTGFEKKGGQKVVGDYYTFGEYDGVLVLEAPNDETIMSFLLDAESQGNFRSVTLKAFPMSEAGKIIKKLS
jgi:uncharacterized protein with GYD domain